MADQVYADSLPENLSIVDTEQQTLTFWRERQVFERSQIDDGSRPRFTFYDGPPFATGLPHHGHLLASTIKDIVPRYMTMRGYFVERRFGWDCHGIPIEYEIDKKLGMPTHEAVNQIGVAGYNQECRQIVMRYRQEWRQTIERLGRWISFDRDYKTMDRHYMESVWWVCAQLWQKGLIYQGTKVMPYSTALQTSLSNFEANSNYQMTQDPAITVRISLRDQPDTDIAIWTTTPWTLPANLLCAVGAKIDYVRARHRDTGRYLIVAASGLERLRDRDSYEDPTPVDMQNLVGQHYIPLFPYFSHHHPQAFKVVLADFVSADDGTGIVHIAPAFGEDDHALALALGIEAHPCPIDAHGCFDDSVSDYQGQYLKEADKGIIQTLKQQQRILQHDTIDHSYPFCPRSDTPLIYRSLPSWFVRVTELKERLVAHNNTVHWVPSSVKDGRFGNWLKDAKDWAISRNRVWGTPVPIWINDTTGNHHCVGSITELAELTGTTIDDLHRDHIDHLTFTKAGEAGIERRISDVFDCWFESGSMPYAQCHYPFENSDAFEGQRFPADFIAEGLDQTRGWFYTLSVLSTALFDQPAFKNVIVNGIVLAKDGKKMSKRLRNYTPPDELMAEYGADALRLYLIHSGLVKAEEQCFSNDGVKDMIRRTLLPWYNAFKFLKTYASIDGWQPAMTPQPEALTILDRWILSRLDTLQSTIAEHMANYALYLVVPALHSFLDDLTNWYIRLNRERFWGEGLSADKQAAYATLYQTVVDFTLMMAPFAPFMAEFIYQHARQMGAHASTTAESVHEMTYPCSGDGTDPGLEAGVRRMQEVILLGRQRRNTIGVKIKMPLRRLTVLHRDPAVLETLKPLEAVIRRELNVHQLELSTDEASHVRLYAKPNAPVLGKRLGKDFRAVAQSIKELSQTDLLAAEDGQALTMAGHTIAAEELLLYREASAEHIVSNRLIALYFDESRDDALHHEGLAREMINRIQKTRKQMGLAVDDRIHIIYQVEGELQAAMHAHQAVIAQETLAERIDARVDDWPQTPQTFDIEGDLFYVVITKIA